MKKVLFVFAISSCLWACHTAKTTTSLRDTTNAKSVADTALQGDKMKDPT